MAVTAPVALHHEGTNGTMLLRGTVGTHAWSNQQVVVLWLLSFVPFVPFVPS